MLEAYHFRRWKICPMPKPEVISFMKLKSGAKTATFKTKCPNTMQFKYVLISYMLKKTVGNHLKSLFSVITIFRFCESRKPCMYEKDSKALNTTMVGVRSQSSRQLHWPLWAWGHAQCKANLVFQRPGPSEVMWWDTGQHWQTCPRFMMPLILN